jgi:hypothetical protein
MRWVTHGMAAEGWTENSLDRRREQLPQVSCVHPRRPVLRGWSGDDHRGGNLLPCDDEGHLGVRFEIEEPQAPDPLGPDVAQLGGDRLLLTRCDLPSLLPPAGSDQHERGHAITLSRPTGIGRQPG